MSLFSGGRIAPIDDGHTCAVCGKPFTIDDAGVANHDSDDSPDGIDYAADRDHVPYDDEEDEP